MCEDALPTLDSIALFIDFLQPHYPREIIQNYWRVSDHIARQLRQPLCDDCHAAFLNTVFDRFVCRLLPVDRTVKRFALFQLRVCTHDRAKIRDPYGLKCRHLQQFCSIVGLDLRYCFCGKDTLAYWRRLAKAVPVVRPLRWVSAEFDDLLCHEQLPELAIEPLDLGPPAQPVQPARPRSCRVRRSAKTRRRTARSPALGKTR